MYIYIYIYRERERERGHFQNLEEVYGTWLRKCSGKRDNCQAHSPNQTTDHPKKDTPTTYSEGLILQLQLHWTWDSAAICHQNGFSSVSASVTPVFDFCVQDRHL